MDVVVMVIFGAVALASVVAAWLRRRGRTRGDGIAKRAGLNFSYGDPFDSTRVAFPLFRKGDERGAENVMWRPCEGLPTVRAFDYWYYDEHKDQYDRVRKTWYWHSCAIALVGGSWPLLTIEPEGLLDRVGQRMGLPDIDLESDEFNRMFVVHCEDRRFATTLIDAQMMEVLVRTGGALSFELRGRWLLVHMDRAASKLLPVLLKVAEDLVAHIPRVVWDLYPSPFATAEGELLPETVTEAMPPLPDEFDDGDDPWEALERSPFDALHVDGRPEYDLDGNVVPPRPERPWSDLPTRDDSYTESWRNRREFEKGGSDLPTGSPDGGSSA